MHKYTQCLPGLGAILLLMCAVMAVYWPIPSNPKENTLFGGDYLRLHIRRIRYAQEALTGTHPHLPGWYSRELLGTPFWANIQNFPFIPTRLVLLALDPLNAYAVGVEIAACLAALLTYLYCREIGMTRMGAWGAAFTFACAGFFAARVSVGHLPLLEAYPALPLLLWLIEKCVKSLPTGKRGSDWMIALGLASCAIMLAGHPQLPVYALIVGLLYALVRMPNRAGLRMAAVMALGVGCAAFALVPLAHLVRLSTRSLDLARPGNDVPFAYGRLKAFVLPWSDGWPDIIGHPGLKPFTGYPNSAWFWDTVCYVGWMPLIAVLFLGARAIVRRRLPSQQYQIIVVSGILAIVLALPLVTQLAPLGRGTIFRSPSRQIYITTFSLAIAFGCGIDVVFRAKSRIGRKWVITGLVVAVGQQVWELAAHDRTFINMVEIPTAATSQDYDTLKPQVGDGRAGLDYDLLTPANREIDDVGFFDSIALAKPYAALLDVGGLPQKANVEQLNGTQLNERALAFAGVKLVVGRIASESNGKFEVPNPAPRAVFFPDSCVIRANAEATHRMLRDPAIDLAGHLMIPSETMNREAIEKEGSVAGSPEVAAYSRPSSDEILVDVNATAAGFVRVLEAFHPGWSAEVDGRAEPIVIADDTFLAVAVRPGPHRVRLLYSTPGAMAGRVISIASLALLVFICRRSVVSGGKVV